MNQNKKLTNIEICFDIIKGKRTVIYCEDQKNSTTLLNLLKELSTDKNKLNYERELKKVFSPQNNCYVINSDLPFYVGGYGELISSGYNVIDLNTFLHLNELQKFCSKKQKMFHINNAVLIMKDYYQEIKILESKKIKDIDFGLGL